MYKKIVIAVAFAAAIVTAAGPSALAAQASPMAQATAGSSTLAAQREARQLPDIECSTQFCDFLGPHFFGTCYATSTSQTNLAGCRNHDESFANDSSSYVRLYYSPSFGGAHVCLKPHTEFPTISSYTFNSGSGLAGFGQHIQDNVASMTLDGSACTNPI